MQIFCLIFDIFINFIALFWHFFVFLMRYSVKTSH